MFENASASTGGSLGGLIDPSEFVCKSADLSVEAITASADGVAAIGSNVVSAVDGAALAWAGVTAPGVFETPDQGAVLSLLDPAVDGAQAMHGVTSRVASALQTYASELGSIKSALVDLEERAAAFRDRALQGYEVSNWDGRGFFGNFTTGLDGNPVPVDDANETTLIPWNQHGPAIEKNQSLVGEYNAIVERVSTAAVACATSIQAELTMVCAAPAEVVTAEALAANPQVSTWGSAVEEDRNCTESVGHGFANFGTGLVSGVGALVGVDPATGVQSWETFGKTWSGVGDFAWSTVVLIPLGVRSMLAGGDLPRGEADYLQERINVVASSWGSLIGWDQQAFLAGEDGWHRWSDDGVATFTESAANIGTFFIPVAGVGKVVLTGTRVGSFVVKVGTHVAEFAVPGGSHLISGVVRVADVSASGVKGGWRGLIDAVRPDAVRPAVVPGVVNVAVDAGRLTPSVTVSESLGLDAPARPAEVPGTGVRGDGGEAGSVAPDAETSAVDSGDGTRATEGSESAPTSRGDVDGVVHVGEEGGSSRAGLTNVEVRRIERLEQLIDMTKADGSPRYDDHVRAFWRGEIFNIENHHRYPLNELHVTKPGTGLGPGGMADAHQSSYNRVDSVVPGEQIVSRKNTQLADVRPQTANGYLTELSNKYGPRRGDVVVADTPTNRRDLLAAGFDAEDVIGKPLKGRQVLEVPVQIDPPPPAFLESARKRGVKIMDVRGTEWRVSVDGTTVVEVGADGSVRAHPVFGGGA